MTEISLSYENPLKKRLGELFFKELPKEPGVYFFLNESGEPLYIGKADNLKRRLMSYQAAKPGQTQEHILEMIEVAKNIRWELHESGEAALKRESDLLRVIRPPYNIAGTDPLPYLQLGLRSEASRKAGWARVDFRLSHREIAEGFTVYGCFRHRGKTKAGYTALLRLFYAASCPRERFHLPARICRSSPPYLYQTEILTEWLKPLQTFLSGDSPELLHLLLNGLLEKTALPKQLYIPLQRDFRIAREFFEAGPQDTREIARLGRLKKTSLSKSQMDRILARQFAGQLQRSLR